MPPTENHHHKNINNQQHGEEVTAPLPFCWLSLLVCCLVCLFVGFLASVFVGCCVGVLFWWLRLELVGVGSGKSNGERG